MPRELKSVQVASLGGKIGASDALKQVFGSMALFLKRHPEEFTILPAPEGSPQHEFIVALSVEAFF